jgi:hypothetical protein
MVEAWDIDGSARSASINVGSKHHEPPCGPHFFKKLTFICMINADNLARDRPDALRASTLLNVSSLMLCLM